jgi:aubergine
MRARAPSEDQHRHQPPSEPTKDKGLETLKSGVKTKPELSENSKEGKSGTTVSLSANYFKLIRMPNFEFNLYRVDFQPDIELAALRKKFVYVQREYLGGYLFDGQSMIYITRRLDVDVKVFNCESREGNKYKMTIKNTGTKIEMTDGMAMQVLNLILRRTMEGLKMQEVGRNLYDPLKKVNYELEIK